MRCWSHNRAGWQTRWLTIAALLVSLAGTLSCTANPPFGPSPIGPTTIIGECAYSLGIGHVPSSLPVGGGIFSVQLTATAGCAWTTGIGANLFQSVSVQPGSGVGSANLQVSVARHTGIQSRTIDIIVATMGVATVQLAGPPLIAGSNAILRYTGTAGDSLSLSQSGVVTTDQYDVPFTSVNGSSTSRIGLQVINRSSASDRFFIIMEAANGQPLASGFYSNPQLWSGGSLPHAVNGLSVFIGTTACDFEGQFEIFDIAFDASARLLRLHSRVFQHCTFDPPGASLTIDIWYPSKGSF